MRSDNSEESDDVLVRTTVTNAEMCEFEEFLPTSNNQSNKRAVNQIPKKKPKNTTVEKDVRIEMLAITCYLLVKLKVSQSYFFSFHYT